MIKIRRVHRLVVVQGRDDPEPGRLVGVISLSDILRALIVSCKRCKRCGDAVREGFNKEVLGVGKGNEQGCWRVV